MLELGEVLGFSGADFAARHETAEEKAAREAAVRARSARSRAVMPGSLMRIQGALIYCLWCTQEGRVSESKSRVREIHKWLDERPAPGDEGRRQREEAGVVEVS